MKQRKKKDNAVMNKMKYCHLFTLTALALLLYGDCLLGIDDIKDEMIYNHLRARLFLLTFLLWLAIVALYGFILKEEEDKP